MCWIVSLIYYLQFKWDIELFINKSVLKRLPIYVLNLFYSQLYMNGTEQHAIPIQGLPLGQMRYIVSF